MENSENIIKKWEPILKKLDGMTPQKISFLSFCAEHYGKKYFLDMSSSLNTTILNYEKPLIDQIIDHPILPPVLRSLAKTNFHELELVLDENLENKVLLELNIRNISSYNINENILGLDIVSILFQKISQTLESYFKELDISGYTKFYPNSVLKLLKTGEHTICVMTTFKFE